MKVQVRVGPSSLTYEAPEDVEIGDKVVVPGFYWQDNPDDGNIGTVTSLEGTYEGPVKPIIRKLSLIKGVK